MRMGHAPGVESFLAQMQNAPVIVPTCSTRTPVLHKKFKSQCVLCVCVCVFVYVCASVYARACSVLHKKICWKGLEAMQWPFEAIASNPIASVSDWK
jgi:hypothetical protein